MKTVHFPPKPAGPGEFTDGAGEQREMKLHGDCLHDPPPAHDPVLVDRLETFFKLGEELSHCQALYRAIGPRGDIGAAAVVLARAARRFALTAQEFAAFNEADELFKR